MHSLATNAAKKRQLCVKTASSRKKIGIKMNEYIQKKIFEVEYTQIIILFGIVVLI